MWWFLHSEYVLHAWWEERASNQKQRKHYPVSCVRMWCLVSMCCVHVPQDWAGSPSCPPFWCREERHTSPPSCCTLCLHWTLPAAHASPDHTPGLACSVCTPTPLRWGAGECMGSGKERGGRREHRGTEKTGEQGRKSRFGTREELVWKWIWDILFHIDIQIYRPSLVQLSSAIALSSCWSMVASWDSIKGYSTSSTVLRTRLYRVTVTSKFWGKRKSSGMDTLEGQKEEGL